MDVSFFLHGRFFAIFLVWRDDASDVREATLPGEGDHL